jgi:hypothetical protein
LFTGVIVNGDKFIAGVVVTGNNCSVFTGVVDTSEKFITSINDTGDH